ncbi:MAG: hypothetical protein OEW41_03385, partial [Actinomycetota bacterium]|nr:hypothetical protein [Actinomycetota bacterium]
QPSPGAWSGLPPDDRPPGAAGRSAYPAPAPRTEAMAAWALACAVGSWFLLPVVLAVVALVLAGAADRSIAESGGWRTGAGLVTAARVVAWVHLVTVVLAVVFVVALLVGLAVGS